jgi:hypothetical protein
MTKTIEATFDGTVFHPIEPIALAPGTRVRLTIETVDFSKHPAPAPVSFLEVAASMNLIGPPDWATNIDQYLYGEEPSSHR